MFGQRGFAVKVTPRHATDLRDGHMGLVHEQQRILGQVFKQSRRRLARRASRQIARVVLDPVAKSASGHHFQIKLCALGNALGLQQLPLRLEQLHRLI